MQRNLRLSVLAVVTGTAIVAGLARQAGAAIIYNINSGAIPLSNLVGTGNMLQVGDKIFSGFAYSTTGADMPSDGAVNVTPEILTVNDTTMWGFNLSGAFQDTNTPGASDAVLRYNVQVTDPTVSLITSATLIGDPNVTGTGNVQVTETWTPNSGSSQVRLYDIEPGNSTQLSDTITFATPASSITVTKDILASVADGSLGSTASVTSIDQLFAQVPAGGSGIPEPASLSLLCLGALGLIVRRR